MYDVAVIGGGPTGCLTANFCGIHDLKTIVFDRSDDVYDLPRAAGLHDDAQRILQSAGVLEEILPFTRVMAGAEFLDANGKRMIGIDIPDGLLTDNGYPVVRNIHQPGVERAIRRGFARFADVELRVSTEVERVEDRGDHVAVQVRGRDHDAPRTIQARWVVAADGARSPVRKSCDIAWNSLGYDCEWLVIDVEQTSGPDLPQLCQQHCDPDRPITFVPMPGRLRRWEFQLKEGETREEMENPARVRELLSPWLKPAHGNVVRAVVYRFHATIAETFRKGRIFLAGDAAHQTPPFMGQGLCTGIRDAENIAWKLAAVRSGLAGDALLDTYTAERKPFAEAMVEHSTNTGKLIDAYAEMQRGGPQPPSSLQEYAYGGSQVLPDLSAGLLSSAESDWIGRLVPNAAVQRDGQAGRFDEVVGHHWGVLTAGASAEMSDETRGLLGRLGARFVTADDPSRSMRALLRQHAAVVIRPDRVIFGPPEHLVPALG